LKTTEIGSLTEIVRLNAHPNNASSKVLSISLDDTLCPNRIN